MKLSIRKKEFIFTIFYIALIIPFFEPSYISTQIPILNRLLAMCRYGSSGIIALIYILDLLSKKKLPSGVMVAAFLYIVTLLFSTVYNHGLVSAAITECLAVFSVFALSDILLRKSLESFLNVLTPIMSMLVIINFLTLLIWPNGMYRSVLVSKSIWSTNNNWFLGYDNAFIVYLLPALLFTIVKHGYVRRSVFGNIMIVVMSVVVLYSVLSRWQAGSIVSMLLFVVLIVLTVLKVKPEMMHSWTYLIGNVVMFFAIIVFGLQYYFANFIMDVLGKDLTFTGRTTIWELSMESIRNAPMLGYGVEGVRDTLGRLRLNSTHNHFLWILYRGGALHFIAFASMIIGATKRLYQKRSLPYVQITAAALCALFVMWQVEAITTNSAMVLFVFAYYVGYTRLGNKPNRL